jgi:hypothetical protein
VHLRIGGFTIQLASRDSGLNLVLNPATARFAVEPSSPHVQINAQINAQIDVQIEVVSGDLVDEVPGELIFDSGGPWRMFRHRDGYVFQFFSSLFGPLPYKTVRWNADFTRGEVCLNRAHFPAGTPVDPLEYPLDELLMINLLGRGRGLEVHGCGVIDGADEAYLFVGQSGAGKTTMARLWLAEPGAVVLSDDRVILRSEPDGVWMYGTPWHGDEPLASPGRARLSRLFLLRHDTTNAIATVSGASAAARLFAASFPPFHSPSGMDFSLRFIETIVTSVPCVELGFAPAPPVVEFLRCSTSSR